MSVVEIVPVSCCVDVTDRLSCFVGLVESVMHPFVIRIMLRRNIIEVIRRLSLRLSNVNAYGTN